MRLAAVDFDGHGWPDLVVRKGGAARGDFAKGGAPQTWLLRNTRDGHFEDVTISSGFRQNRTVADPNKGRPGEVVAFADIDNDPMKPETETSELLIDQGDGTFALGPADGPVHADLHAASGLPLHPDPGRGAQGCDLADRHVTKGAPLRPEIG